MATLLAAGALAGKAASTAGAAASLPGSQGLASSGPLSQVTPIGMATSTATRAGLKQAGYGGDSSSGMPGSSMFSSSGSNSSMMGQSGYSGGSSTGLGMGMGAQPTSPMGLGSGNYQSPALSAADPCINTGAADPYTRVPGVHVSWDPVVLPLLGHSPVMRQQQQFSQVASPVILPQQQQLLPQQQCQQQQLPMQGETTFMGRPVQSGQPFVSGEQDSIVVRYDDAAVLPIFGTMGQQSFGKMEYMGSRPEGIIQTQQLPISSGVPLSSTTYSSGVPATSTATGEAPVAGAPLMSRDRDYDHGLMPSTTDKIKDTLGVANVGPQPPTASALSRDRNYNYGNPPSVTDKIKDTLGVANTGPQKRMFATEADLPAGQIPQQSALVTGSQIPQQSAYSTGVPMTSAPMYSSAPISSGPVYSTVPVSGYGAPVNAATSAATFSRDRDYDHGLMPSTTDKIKDTLGVANTGPQAPTASTLSGDRNYNYGYAPTTADRVKDTLGVTNTGPQQPVSSLPAQIPQQSAYSTAVPMTSAPMYSSAPISSGPVYSAVPVSGYGAPVNAATSAATFSRDRDYDHGLMPSTTDKIKDTLGVANTGPQAPTASTLSDDRNYNYGYAPTTADRVKDTLGVTNTGPQQPVSSLPAQIPQQSAYVPMASAPMYSSAPISSGPAYSTVPMSSYGAPVNAATSASTFSRDRDYDHGLMPSTTDKIKDTLGVANTGPQAPTASTLSGDRNYNYGYAPTVTDRVKDTLGVTNTGPQQPVSSLPAQISQQSAMSTTGTSAPVSSTSTAGAAPVAGASLLSRDRDYDHGLQPSITDKIKDTLGVANTGPQKQMFASDAALPTQIPQQSAMSTTGSSAPIAPASTSTAGAAPVAGASVLSRDRDYDHGLQPSITDKVKDTLGVANTGPQPPVASAVSRDRDYNYGNPPSVTDKIKDTLGLANTGPQKQMFASDSALPSSVPTSTAFASAPTSFTGTGLTGGTAPLPVAAAVADSTPVVPVASTLSRDRDYNYGREPSLLDKVKDTLHLSNTGPQQAPVKEPATAPTLSRDRDYNHGMAPSTSDRVKDTLGLANVGPQAPTASALSRDRDYDYGHAPSITDRIKDMLGVANTGPQKQVAGAGEWDAYAVRPGEWARHSALQPAAAMAPPNAGNAIFAASSNAPIGSSSLVSNIPPAPPVLDSSPVISTSAAEVPLSSVSVTRQSYPVVAYHAEGLSTLPATSQVVVLPIDATTTVVPSVTYIEPASTSLYSKASPNLTGDIRAEGQPI